MKMPLEAMAGMEPKVHPSCSVDALVITADGGERSRVDRLTTIGIGIPPITNHIVDLEGPPRQV